MSTRAQRRRRRTQGLMPAKHLSVVGGVYIGNGKSIPVRLVDFDGERRELTVEIVADTDHEIKPLKMLYIDGRAFTYLLTQPHFRTDGGTIRFVYLEHVAGTSLIDQPRNFAVQYWPAPIAVAQELGVRGTLYCVAGTPHRQGGTLPHNVHDEHEGKLEVMGYDPSRQITLYLNSSLNVSWQSPSAARLSALLLDRPQPGQLVLPSTQLQYQLPIAHE